MKRTRVLVAVLAIISLPILLVVVGAVSFHAANHSNGFITSSGMRREYVLYVPRSYDPARPTPLIISMHAAALWGATQREISGWNRIADGSGAIVVYPSAMSGDGPRRWRVEPGPGLMKDVRFIAELIDTLERRYNIDKARIYANGLSNGGGMSFVLSCTLADRIAAIGLVAAAQTLPWLWCKDQHAVPMIAFHGTADRQVLYNGGASWVSPRPFPSVAGWASNWARRNGCHSTPVATHVNGEVDHVEYTACVNEANVELYTIKGGGHTWPGGGALPEWFVGRTSHSIDATSVMWRFFLAHPLMQQ